MQKNGLEGLITAQKINTPRGGGNIEKGSEKAPPGQGVFNFEELASQTKELVRLTTNFGIETCAACGFKGCMDWQVNYFDGSWGLLCDSCGQKLVEKLNEEAS